MKKMRKKINFTYFTLAFVFVVACGHESFSQSKQAKIDSLHAKFVADSAYLYRYKKYKFLLAIDTRNSFIRTGDKTPVDVNGIQLGVIVDGKHNIGLGFYSISHIQKTTPVVGDNQKPLNVNLKLGYTTVFYEYMFVDTKRWEIGVLGEIGWGSYQTTVTDSAGKRDPTFKDTLQRGIALFGAGLDVSLKIWTWLGFNAMGGYRIVGGDEPNKVNFNGAFYSVGVQVHFGELRRMYRVGVKRRLYKSQVEKINKGK